MNGKRGDHPITDILTHNLDIYGNEGAELIRKIASLCSRRELNEWWSREIGFRGDGEMVLNKGRKYLDELTRRAKTSGWETDR
jgi:hypothetical protein